METERGDLVMFRQPFADFPRMGEVITVGKRRGRALLETGIKGKGVVEAVPLDRIFSKVQ